MLLTVELRGEGSHARTNLYVGDQCSHKVNSSKWLYDLLVCDRCNINKWRGNVAYAVMIWWAKTKETGNEADTRTQFLHVVNWLQQWISNLHQSPPPRSGLEACRKHWPSTTWSLQPPSQNSLPHHQIYHKIMVFQFFQVCPWWGGL